MFSPNKPIVAEFQRNVVTQQNFVPARRTPIYMNTNGRSSTAPNPLTSAELTAPVHGAVGSFYTFASVATGWITPIRSDIRIATEIQVLRCTVRCFMSPGGSGEVRFTIGGGTVTLAVSDANDGGRVVGTILVSASGTGLQDVTVELRRLVSGSSVNPPVMNSCRIQSAVIAATDLPDPANS